MASLSAGGEGDHDGVRDLPTWGADPTVVSGPSNGERDRTGADGGERTTNVGGVYGIAEGDGETSSLGDGVSLGNGNDDLRGLDIIASSTDTNLG